MPPKNLLDGQSAGMTETQVETMIGVSGNLSAQMVMQGLELSHQLKTIKVDLSYLNLTVPNMLASIRSILSKVTLLTSSGLMLVQVVPMMVLFGESNTLHSIGAEPTTISLSLLTPFG
jgi:hypothetical protein